MFFAEAVNRREMRLVASSKHSKSHIIPGGALKLSRRKDYDAIAVQQQSHHHFGLIRQVPAGIFFSYPRFEVVQVQLFDHIQDKKKPDAPLEATPSVIAETKTLCRCPFPSLLMS